MTTTHDTSRTIEIEGSPAKLILLSVLGLVMTGASLFVVLYPPLRTDIMAQIVGYFGTLFFGLCTLIGFVRLVRAGRPVVTISPLGIQDVRVASETIPWAAIKNISTWSGEGQRSMVLAVDPAVERTLTLTTIARWTRRANAMLGADGLCVTAAGLRISYPALLSTTTAYAQAHGGIV
jgi:hypothetical protein